MVKMSTEEMIERRWAMLLEGRCPVCEAIMQPPDEDGDVMIEHADDCVVADGILEHQAVEVEGKVLVAMGYTIERNGESFTLMGPAIALMPKVVRRHIEANRG